MIPAPAGPEKSTSTATEDDVNASLLGKSIMSLNYKEINLILTELDIAGSKIQRILQPSYDSLVFEVFKNGRKKYVLMSVGTGACRIHELAQEPSRNDRPLRFMECLRSRIRGGKILEAHQLSQERIVKLSILVAPAPDSVHPQPDSKNINLPHGDFLADGSIQYSLFIRLWSGAGNILLVDSNSTIIDALYRKPEKGEVSGLLCEFDQVYGKTTCSSEVMETLERKYTIRDLPGEGSFSSKIAEFYRTRAGELSRDTLIFKAREKFEKKSMELLEKQKKLENLREEYSRSERYREIGDVLLAYTATELPIQRELDTAKSSASLLLETYDFFTKTNISIQVDPTKSTVENARLYYEKAKKAKTGLADVINELGKIEIGKKNLALLLEKIEIEKDPYAIAKTLEKSGTVRENPKRRYPCLAIDSRGWILLVGRSAKENDELLRHHVRGSDHWLHARDYSGAYVFIKTPKGKSIPLDILLDAGTLAIYYSKARQSLEGDIYHTLVKHLKRVKDGPKGLVIPMLEKNLFIRVESDRIKNLLENTIDTKGDTI
jgi:predicted ribosome quality control (RQC) complex YloA/Tae2 family protein